MEHDTWIIDNKPHKPIATRVIECGRRVHAAGLLEDLLVRCLDDWNRWWEDLQAKARRRELHQVLTEITNPH